MTWSVELVKQKLYIFSSVMAPVWHLFPSFAVEVVYSCVIELKPKMFDLSQLQFSHSSLISPSALQERGHADILIMIIVTLALFLLIYYDSSLYLCI